MVLNWSDTCGQVNNCLSSVFCCRFCQKHGNFTPSADTSTNDRPSIIHLTPIPEQNKPNGVEVHRKPTAPSVRKPGDTIARPDLPRPLPKPAVPSGDQVQADLIETDIRGRYIVIGPIGK